MPILQASATKSLGWRRKNKESHRRCGCALINDFTYYILANWILLKCPDANLIVQFPYGVLSVGQDMDMIFVAPCAAG